MSVNALLLAGGHGNRLWPLSQPDAPKQCLPIIKGKSFLRCTLDRLQGVVPPEAIYLATGIETAAAVYHELPEIPQSQAIIEPYPRDTAPCIGLAAVLMVRRDPEAIMISLPCDHIIHDVCRFRDCLQRAVAAAGNDVLVTIGIVPEYPATEYGYLRCGGAENGGVAVIERFVEKPDRETAAGFLADERYLWNSGIFVWKARRILEEIAIHAPDLNEGLNQIQQVVGTPRYERVLEEVFKTLPADSIDRAVMEKARGIVTVKADFGWRDSGNWDSFASLLDSDEDGNAVHGDLVSIDTSGCVVWSDLPVAAMGVKDMVIVSANGAILVCARDRVRDVKNLLRHIEGGNRKEA